MKFAICNEIFKGWKLEDAMVFVKKTGYDAIEIAPFTLATYVTDIPPERRKEIKANASKNGIAISGIHWVLAQTEGLHLTHPDEEIRTRTSQYLSDLVDFCADIGGQFMVLGSPQQRNIIAGVTKELAWQWAKSSLRPAILKAEERGVTICLEPLGPSETNFINKAEEAIRFVQQSNSGRFKVALDVKAMSSELKPIPQIIRESAHHIGYFHANDKNLKGPGFGDVDFAPIVAALKQAGYDGYASVEVFNFDEGPETIATKSLDYLKMVFV